MKQIIERFKLNGMPRLFTIFGVVLLLCLAAIGSTTSTALAAPGPCSGPPSERPPECDGGGGGTLTPTDTSQQWTGSGEISSAPRDCYTHGFNANTGSVSIGCDQKDTSPDVHIQFSFDDIIASGRIPELCELLSDGLVFGSPSNRITDFEAMMATEWNGTICLDDGSGTTTCEIWVRNTAYGEMCHASELVSGACPGERLIILEGVGTGAAAPAPELNPFTVVDQNIVLNELTFWIKAIGKNRTEATCAVNFGSELAAPVIIFHTTPR